MTKVYVVDQSSGVDTSWLIDVGPFFDRFGSAKLAVLSSTNGNVAAAVKDAQVRKWIDLKRTEVAQFIDLIIAAGIPGVDANLKAAILNTPVSLAEQYVLLKLYFS